MTQEEIDAMDRAYQEASFGSDTPNYIEGNIPEIGFIQAANGGVLRINGVEATPEQAHLVAEWFNRQCTRR